MTGSQQVQSGSPQGCVPSSSLSSLTCDCSDTVSTNDIIKFSKDTANVSPLKIDGAADTQVWPSTPITPRRLKPTSGGLVPSDRLWLSGGAGGLLHPSREHVHRPSWERSYLLTGERHELNREEKIIGASLLHLQLSHEFKGLHSPLSWLLRSGQRCKSINEGPLNCETWELLFCFVFFKHLFPFSVSSLVMFKKYSSILNPVW